MLELGILLVVLGLGWLVVEKIRYADAGDYGLAIILMGAGAFLLLICAAQFAENQTTIAGLEAEAATLSVALETPEALTSAALMSQIAAYNYARADLQRENQLWFMDSAVPDSVDDLPVLP